MAWLLNLPLSLYSYDTWIPASEIEAAVEDAPSPEKPRKVRCFLLYCVTMLVKSTSFLLFLCLFILSQSKIFFDVPVIEAILYLELDQRWFSMDASLLNIEFTCASFLCARFLKNTRTLTRMWNEYLVFNRSTLYAPQLSQLYKPVGLCFSIIFLSFFAKHPRLKCCCKLALEASESTANSKRCRSSYCVFRASLARGVQGSLGHDSEGNGALK